MTGALPDERELAGDAVNSGVGNRSTTQLAVGLDFPSWQVGLLALDRPKAMDPLLGPLD